MATGPQLVPGPPLSGPTDASRIYAPGVTAAHPNPGLQALVGAVLEEDLDRLTTQLVAQMRETEASYAAMPLDALTDRVRENLESVARDLYDGEVTHLDSARQNAAARAEQGVPLTAVLHAYRLGFTTFWDALVAAAERVGLLATQELVSATTTVWSVHNDHVQVVTDAYHQTLVDLARRHAERRLDVLDALFDGRVGDWHELGGSPEALDLPRKGPYLAVMAETPSGLAEPASDLQLVFRDRGIRSAWRHRTTHQVGVVAVPDARTLERARDLLVRTAPGRVGLSEEFSELTDAWERVQEASLAQRCLPEGSRGVASLADDPLLSLLGASPVLAQAVARRVLRGLYDRDEDEQQLLLTTLCAWFDADGNTGGAAASLYCHRNTVNNRLRRIEHLTKRSLSSPRDVALLFVAARALPFASTD